MSESILLSLTAPAGQSTSDFTVDLSRIKVSEASEWTIGLVGATLVNSVYNISAAKANNTVTIIWNAVVHLITLPDGGYSVGQIQSYIHAYQELNALFTVNPDTSHNYEIVLTGNASTLHVDLKTGPSSQVQFIGSNFATLLGFVSGSVFVINTNTTSPLLADISDGVSSYLIQCSLVSNSYQNGLSSRVLREFTPNAAPGSYMIVEPANVIRLPLSRDTDYLDAETRIFITDQRGLPLDFNGEKLSFSVELRRGPPSV